jgi:16S rRNA processing protein RimM
VAEWEEMALVGRVARAHGNRGQVIVDPVTDFPDERFSPGAILFIRRAHRVEPVTIEAVRFHRGRPILGLIGIDTMSAAEALAGAELRVSAETLRPLPGGSFYRHDLVGCLVETKQGARVGEVTSVEGDATGSRLVVRGRSGEILIPLAEGICVEVDVAAKKIVVDPPDGLMELNAPARQKF